MKTLVGAAEPEEPPHLVGVPVPGFTAYRYIMCRWTGEWFLHCRCRMCRPDLHLLITTTSTVGSVVALSVTAWTF